MFALLRRCHEIDLHCVHLRLHLFDSLVKPILWYGCEVWLPSLLSRHRNISDNPFFIELESMHKRFLKQCLGLRLSTSDSILMTELHRHPLHLSALRQTFTFRNKIMARHDNDLVKMAMLDSTGIELAREGARCWVSNLARYYPSILVAHQLPLSLLDSLSPNCMVYRYLLLQFPPLLVPHISQSLGTDLILNGSGLSFRFTTRFLVAALIYILHFLVQHPST